MQILLDSVTLCRCSHDEKAFLRVAEESSSCDSVHGTQLHAGSVGLNRNCSHMELVGSPKAEQRGMARLLLLTQAFLFCFFFCKHFLDWIFFSAECVHVLVGRHLNITKPGFLDFSAAILSAS